MVQTRFETELDSNDKQIAIPLGIVRLVRSSFKRFRFYELLDSFKESGVPLGKVIENMCINSLNGDFSINAWDEKIQKSSLRKEYLCGDAEIRRWTMQRALERIGDYLEEIVDHLLRVTRTLYPSMPTHTYVDGSHIKRYGPKGKNVKYGEGGGTVQLQDQFMISSSIMTGIPVSVELYPGNQNDPQQFNDFIPQLLFLMKPESLIVMDNGGSNAALLDEITEWGDHYITRVRMNASDEKAIEAELGDMVYVDMGTACIMHTFESSQRTIYRFFSIDSYIASIHRAEKAVAAKEIARMKAQKVLMKTNLTGLVKFDKNPFYRVEVDDIRIVMTDDPWVELNPEKELKSAIPTIGGWFKLESSLPLDPKIVLLIYRHRVEVEHLISSIKSVINLDPMRVWGECSTRGKLVLGLITQYIVSSALYEMEPDVYKKMIDGKFVTVKRKYSSKTFVQELKDYQGTLTRNEWGGLKIKDLKDDGVAEKIIPIIEKYEVEGPLDLPESSSLISHCAAQWNQKEKNLQDLAMSIEQDFKKIIFSDRYRSGRSWLDVCKDAMAVENDSNQTDFKGKYWIRGSETDLTSTIEQKKIPNCSMDVPKNLK